MVSMPDTPSNQRAYPQNHEQKPGLGFPIARIGALIGLASGAILRYQVAACEGKGTGEQSLLENLLGHLNAGDVVLADALLATWWIVAGASRRGADVVMAQHGSRITDFRRGQRLGKNDHVVQWPRPPKPRLMSAEEYARYPAFITMREVEVNGRMLVTTLRDPQFVSARALDALYKMRWNIEVDFRAIKATLQMDVLRLQIAADGGEGDRGLSTGLQPGALGDGQSGIALGRTTTRARLYRRQAAAEHICRSATSNAWQSNTRHDCDRTRKHRHITSAASPRPDRTARQETTTYKNLPLLTVPRHIARELIYARRTA